jgi:hypothetical protein
VNPSRRRHLEVEDDAGHVEITAPQLDHFGDDVAQVDRRRRAGLLAAEAREVADDLAGAPALRLEHGNLVERLRRQIALALEQLRSPRIACRGLFSS